MSFWKGQSAIEYMTTYGWMVVAVSIVGGTVYTQVDFSDSCQLGTSEFSPPFPTVTETYQYDNGTVFLQITNPEEDPVKLKEITVKNGNNTLGSIGVGRKVGGEASIGVTTNRFSTSENCKERTLQISYESGTLENLVTTGKIKGRITIVPLVALFEVNTTTADVGQPIEFNASLTESENPVSNYTWRFGDGSAASGKIVTHNYSESGVYIVELTVEDTEGTIDTKRKRVYIGSVLRVGGGQIPRLGIQTSLATNCIGPDCRKINGSSQEAVVSRGDTMTGTLFTEKILMPDSQMCITDPVSYGTDEGCSVYRIGSEEPVSVQNYMMNGSLETPTVKPSQQSLCLGNNC